MNTKKILSRHGLHAKKHLGQHFLVDQEVLGRIVLGAGIEADDVVVEVGPGIGALTSTLAEKAGLLIAIELDQRLLPALAETTGKYSNVKIVQGNALQINLDRLVAEHTDLDPVGNNVTPYKIVANLPYYITSPLVMHFLTSGFHVHRLVLMVQMEVARRMAAAPGTKAYGAFSVAVQYYSIPSLIAEVPAKAFLPPPEVTSAVICLDVRPKPAVAVPDEKLFFAVVKAAFGQRRKTLLNALCSGGLGLAKEQAGSLLDGAGISPLRRGEELSLQEFADITAVLHGPG